MLNRVVLIVVVVPVAVALIALAVANRAPVAFTLDPFNPGNPALTTALPLFVLLFVALVCGMIIGSLATWLRQGRYRREARAKGKEVQNLLRQTSQAAPAPAREAGAGVPAART
ncbi:lipopolysaccharide assembly protein LapA domain-containing protein [Nitratireductor alexandrii]|uniref:lipopolysaccharide assembly protein LapA domain-containing protein n=1 Tax=Nitratireductor alexandrii TaxID=2448161 RepID=UPI000FDAC601|nr:LapA family protein [Nitratireductor alexandrii]